jgi:serine protease Do
MSKTLTGLLLSFLLTLGLAPAARADSLFDEGRLQAIVEHQSGVLVRVKAAVEERAAPAADDASVKANDKNISKNEIKDEKKSEPKSEPKTFLRLGTGFFVSSDGQIITNASIVDNAKRLWYEVDGMPYLAELKGIDAPTNIAILQAKTMPATIPTVNLADNVTLPQTGSLLVRLSLPMDFPATPSVGIMQGADTQFGLRAFPTRYLRVQMNTGPGEAGAPVFDLQGRFVGITVAVLPELEATYVLPARALSWVRETMKPEGRVYSYFGFNVDEDHSLSDGTRLVVKNIDEKGPAAKADLRVGDVVTEAAHRGAFSISDLRDAAFYTKPGEYLDMKVRRDNRTIAVAVQAVEKK